MSPGDDDELAPWEVNPYITDKQREDHRAKRSLAEEYAGQRKGAIDEASESGPRQYTPYRPEEAAASETGPQDSTYADQRSAPSEEQPPDGSIPWMGMQPKDMPPGIRTLRGTQEGFVQTGRGTPAQEEALQRAQLAQALTPAAKSQLALQSLSLSMADKRRRADLEEKMAWLKKGLSNGTIPKELAGPMETQLNTGLDVLKMRHAMATTIAAENQNKIVQHNMALTESIKANMEQTALLAAQKKRAAESPELIAKHPSGGHYYIDPQGKLMELTPQEERLAKQQQPVREAEIKAQQRDEEHHNTTLIKAQQAAQAEFDVWKKADASDGYAMFKRAGWTDPQMMDMFTKRHMGALPLDPEEYTKARAAKRAIGRKQFGQSLPEDAEHLAGPPPGGAVAPPAAAPIPFSPDKPVTPEQQRAVADIKRYEAHTDKLPEGYREKYRAALNGMLSLVTKFGSKQAISDNPEAAAQFRALQGQVSDALYRPGGPLYKKPSQQIEHEKETTRDAQGHWW